MNKKRLQEIAGITPTSTKLAGLISQAINQVDENLSYSDFAEAVAYILKQDYGSHNFEPFIRTLQAELGDGTGE